MPLLTQFEGVPTPDGEFCAGPRSNRPRPVITRHGASLVKAATQSQGMAPWKSPRTCLTITARSCSSAVVRLSSPVVYAKSVCRWEIMR
jgi:hypothetical protein